MQFDKQAVATRLKASALQNGLAGDPESEAFKERERLARDLGRLTGRNWAVGMAEEHQLAAVARFRDTLQPKAPDPRAQPGQVRPVPRRSAKDVVREVCDHGHLHTDTDEAYAFGFVAGALEVYDEVRADL